MSWWSQYTHDLTRGKTTERAPKRGASAPYTILTTEGDQLVNLSIAHRSHLINETRKSGPVTFLLLLGTLFFSFVLLHFFPLPTLVSLCGFICACLLLPSPQVSPSLAPSPSLLASLSLVCTHSLCLYRSSLSSFPCPFLSIGISVVSSVWSLVSRRYSVSVLQVQGHFQTASPCLPHVTSSRSHLWAQEWFIWDIQTAYNFP